jgi:hypothetical protein
MRADPPYRIETERLVVRCRTSAGALFRGEYPRTPAASVEVSAHDAAGARLL